jgi:hypothetical protein
MKEFMEIQDPEEIPYNGLILLDENLVVFDAYIINTQEEDLSKMIGSSYSGIEFKGDNDSLSKVLTLYRVDANHPMGQKGIEVAFEMHEDDYFLGWLIFQMNMEALSSKYGMDEKDLEKFSFKKS